MDANMDISVDYNVLDTGINAIKDIKGRCSDLISAFSSVDVSILDTGYLLPQAVSTVEGIMIGPIETVLSRVTEVETLFYLFQSEDFFKDYLNEKGKIDAEKLIIDMLDLVSTQENCFNMVERYDEVLEKYSVILKELQSQISFYEKYSNGTFTLGSYDYMVTARDIQLIEESNEKLPGLQEKYEDLYQAMSLVNMIRNYTMDKAFYLYGTYEDFEQNSSLDGRIASYEARNINYRDIDSFRFYDANGNLLEDVSDVEAGIYFASINDGHSFDNFSFEEYYNVYRYLTDDEKKIASYLYNTGNSEKLEEYFSFKTGYANQRHGYELANEVIAKIDSYYENSDNGFSDTVAYIKTLSLLSFEGFGDGLVNFFDGISNLFSADGVVSTEQYKTSFIVQALSERYDDKKFADIVATGAYEISNSMGNMLPSIALGIITGCPAVGTVAMGLSSAGNAREQGLQSGMNDTQAWVYGILSGTSEAALEYFIGGIPGVSNLETWAKLPGWKGFLAKMGGEFVEEATQSVLEPLFNTIVTGEEYRVDWGEVLKSGIYGAITAGAMNGGQIVIGKTVYSMVNMSSDFLSYLADKYNGQDITDPDIQAQLKQDLSASEADSDASFETNTLDSSMSESDVETSSEIETLDESEVPDISDPIESMYGDIPDTLENAAEKVNPTLQAARTALDGIADLVQKKENMDGFTNSTDSTDANNLSDSKVQEMTEEIVRRVDFVPVKVANKLANFFAEATTAAMTKYNGFFRAFREHTIYHTLAVAEYVQTKGQTLNVNLKETAYAALCHDLGMKGGLKENEDGSFSLIDEGLVRVRNQDGTYKFCKLGDDGVPRNLTFKETYDLALATRKAHPVNSAITILTNPDLIPADVDIDKVAVLALSHSKSTSGLKHYSNKSEWLGCVDKLEKALAAHNNYYQSNYQFDGQKIRNMITDTEEDKDTRDFRQLRDEALLLRDADAMSDAVFIGGKLLMQDGTLSEVSRKNPRGNDYNREIMPGFAEELIDEGITDTIYREDGTIDHFDITDDSQSKSVKVHVGERKNVKFDSKYDGEKYYAEASLIDPNFSPNCTWGAIVERLGEVVTYDHVKDRLFVIKLPKEVLGEDGNGTVLSKWYESRVKDYNTLISESKEYPLSAEHPFKIRIEYY